MHEHEHSPPTPALGLDSGSDGGLEVSRRGSDLTDIINYFFPWCMYRTTACTLDESHMHSSASEGTFRLGICDISVNCADVHKPVHIIIYNCIMCM